MRASRPPFASLAAAVLLTATAVSAVRYSGPPPVAGDITPEAMFSAQRALPVIRALASAPHPMGSAEHGRVRDALVAHLAQLGLTVEHQVTTGTRVRSQRLARGTIIAGRVENLLVRLPGKATTGSVLLAAHYDSVAAGPGAADDMAAVAAVIETLRAVKASAPLRNDVIALFSDGEEDGLLGAEAFVSHHPLARSVRVFLNFEARGTGGPVQMFETTGGNGALVRAWAQNVPRPSGTSLAYEVYKRLPNDTDFTELKRMDAVGLNFAFIGEPARYHTPLDSIDQLDRRSVQGHGEVALSLVRTFGDANLDLKDWRTGNAVFFSLPGGLVVRYPTFFAMPIAVALLVAWVAVFVRTRRRGDTSIGGAILAMVPCAALLGGLGWASLHVPDGLRAVQALVNPVAAPAGSRAYALGLVALVLMCWTLLHSVLRLKMTAHTLALAAAFVLAGAGSAVAWVLPGASYLLAWPAGAALLSVMALPASKGDAAPAASHRAALVLLAVPALAILVPTGDTVMTALGLGVEGAAGLVVLTGVLCLALSAQLELTTFGSRWWAAAAVGLVALGAIAAGPFTATFNDRRPRPENVFYALDANAERALWATSATTTTPWLEQFVSNNPKDGPLPGFTAIASLSRYLSHDAPLEPLPAPSLEVEQSIAEDGGRALTMRITSPRRARSLSMRFPEREVLDTRVNGHQVINGVDRAAWLPGRWGLEFSNVPAEGIEVFVRVKGKEPLTVIVADRSDGLPAGLVSGFAPRPATSQPIQRGDMTVVQRTFTF
jgi:hypothetical protein